MTTKLIADDINLEPGCYVEGGWGWRGSSHLIEQFSDNTQALRLARAYDRGWTIGNLPEVIYDITGDIEAELNEALPDDMVAMWIDGEFFISPFCDEDPNCDSDECACRAW